MKRGSSILFIPRLVVFFQMGSLLLAANEDGSGPWKRRRLELVVIDAMGIFYGKGLKDIELID